MRRDHILPRDTDTRVLNAQRPVDLIGLDVDIEWNVQIDGRAASIGTLAISRLYMAQLLKCVAGIGQELAEEDFIVGVEGIGPDI